MEIAQSRSAINLRVRPPQQPRVRWKTVMLHATLIFFCLIVLLPLAWVFLLSVKSLPEAYTGTFLPAQVDFSHYTYVFQVVPDLLRNMSNSIIVTLSTVVLTCICAVLAGYVLAPTPTRTASGCSGLVGSLFSSRSFR
jgi:ABC-type glycerol-3-phosphate transport system permease component